MEEKAEEGEGMKWINVWKNGGEWGRKAMIIGRT
jgi:hypothetical protein